MPDTANSGICLGFLTKKREEQLSVIKLNKNCEENNSRLQKREVEPLDLIYQGMF